MKFSRFLALALVASWALSTAAQADVIWTFDLPATAVASQSPPYPVVAWLTLTEEADGVHFFLDPNEASPGAQPPEDSFVKSLDYVYSGFALTAGDFRFDSGAPIDTFSYLTGSNMDAGYSANDEHIVVNFSDSGASQFDFTETSRWTVLGTTLSQFTSTWAESNSMPTPIQGAISVAPYTSPKPPTPSNWVAATAPIPEPATLLLLGAGLAGLGLASRRRKTSI